MIATDHGVADHPIVVPILSALDTATSQVNELHLQLATAEARATRYEAAESQRNRRFVILSVMCVALGCATVSSLWALTHARASFLAAQREAEASKIELTRSASIVLSLQTSLDVNQKSLSSLVADLKSTTQATTESQRDATAAYTKQLNQLIDDNARLKVEADKLRSELESARKATASGLPAKS